MSNPEKRLLVGKDGGMGRPPTSRKLTVMEWILVRVEHDYKTTSIVSNGSWFLIQIQSILISLFCSCISTCFGDNRGVSCNLFCLSSSMVVVVCWLLTSSFFNCFASSEFNFWSTCSSRLMARRVVVTHFGTWGFSLSHALEAKPNKATIFSYRIFIGMIFNLIVWEPIYNLKVLIMKFIFRTFFF